MEPGIACPLARAEACRTRRMRRTLRHTGVSARLTSTQSECASQVWARSFLFAGLSALLLAVAALRPGIAFLPFLALIPFFYGLLLDTDRSARESNSVRLGFLLGLAYQGVTLADSLLTSPIATFLKLAGGTTLFALFGWAAGQTRRRWGFNPVILASIWVVLELSLIRLGLTNDILGAKTLISGTEHNSGAAFFYKTAVIFGLLAISFIIVLLNSVFVLAIETLIALAQARGMAQPESEETRDLFLTPGLVAQRLYLMADGRGPPRQRLFAMR